MRTIVKGDVGMTETEALAAIAALCNKAANGIRSPLVTQVRAILARVESGAVPPQGIDRDALLGILWTVKHGGDPHWALREILALVRPVEGVVIEPEYQAAVHKLLWTALLPNTDLTLEERTEGEYYLARLAEKLEQRAALRAQEARSAAVEDGTY